MVSAGRGGGGLPGDLICICICICCLCLKSMKHSCVCTYTKLYVNMLKGPDSFSWLGWKTIVSAVHGRATLPSDHHKVLTILNLFLLRMSLFLPFMVEVGLSCLEVNHHWLLTKALGPLICQ